MPLTTGNFTWSEGECLRKKQRRHFCKEKGVPLLLVHHLREQDILFS